MPDAANKEPQGTPSLESWIHHSPRQLAQRQRIHAVFGPHVGQLASASRTVQRVAGLIRGQHVLVGMDQRPGVVLAGVGEPGQETRYRVYFKDVRIIDEIDEASVAADPAGGDMTAEQAEAQAQQGNDGDAQPSALPLPSAQVDALAQLDEASGVALQVDADALAPLVAVPEPLRLTKAKAYLGALQHIRLVPVFEKKDAGDSAGMGHLSASRQSVDNLLLLGFRGTIEVVYSNNGFNEDAFRDLFPAFPQGGELLGSHGSARITYIPLNPKDAAPGLRMLSEQDDVNKLHAKNSAEFPQREVALINNWDKGAYDSDSTVEELLAPFANLLDLDPGNSRRIVSLHAFGWHEMGQRFISDTATRTGSRLRLPPDGISGYQREAPPDPIKDSVAKGPEAVKAAVEGFIRQHPVLKANASTTVSVRGLTGVPVPITCRQGSTIGQLKVLVHGQTGVPPGQQALTFNAQVLADGTTLYEAGVGQDAVIDAARRDGDEGEAPAAVDSALVSGAPEGKMQDIHTMNTMSAILEGTALQQWDLLPGYGFHNAGSDSLERMALAARQVQTRKAAPKPIVFVSMRHLQVPSEALLVDQAMHFVLLRAESAQTPMALQGLTNQQVAIVISGGIPGPLFNQLASSATLPIALEGAGTASFAIERGIPYIALQNNASIMDVPSSDGADRLRSLGDWLSAKKAEPGEAQAEAARVNELATVMIESTDEDAPMGQYFNAVKTEMRRPERHQMAAAFEQLYEEVPPTATLRAQPPHIGVATAEAAYDVRFTLTFSKAPAKFLLDQLTILAAGAVSVAAVDKTIRQVPPEAGSGPVAVGYEVTLVGVTGAGSLTASLDAGKVHDLDGTDFPAATGSGRVDVQLT